MRGMSDEGDRGEVGEEREEERMGGKGVVQGHRKKEGQRRVS